MAPSDPQHWTYTDYICFLRSHGFQNLAGLDEFLQWGLEASRIPTVQKPQRSTSILLEFGDSSFRTSDLTDTNKLRSLVREWTRSSAEPKSPKSKAAEAHKSDVQGRILMVNNISPEVIDSIGGLLNIEPVFFTTHLADHGTGTASDFPTGSPLASSNERHQKHSFTVEYPCTFIPAGCGKEIDIEKLYCKGNYRRRVEICSKTGKQKVAVARRKISFYMKRTIEPWLCVVLVDPPISFFTVGTDHAFGAYSPTQRLDVTGYQGGYLDFIEHHRPASKSNHDYRDCSTTPMCPNSFDDLCRHWQLMARSGNVDFAQASLLEIMKPAFQIAASESANFFSYINTTLNAQSINTSLTADTVKTKRALDRVITLDTLLSRYKPLLTATKTYVASHADLSTDYRALLIDLHHHRAECDSQIQHLLALSSLASSSSLASLSSESSRQVDYSRYLTIIALIYVPFALACGVFSLPGDFAPAAHYYAGFIPATAGVAIVLLLLVLPESRDPLPALKAAFCGGLTERKLLAKPKGTGRSTVGLASVRSVSEKDADDGFV